MPTFGNVLGFWALLGVPVILAIHFLQRESRQVTTSTLFLLEQLAPESAQGRRWERLRNSATLWLQLVAILLLTWVLVQPRWLRPNSTQHVVIVVDSSVSMSAFKTELIENLDRVTSRLTQAAAKTEWQVLESDVQRPTLYSGTDRAALISAVRKWKPHLGSHDFSPALEMGQTLLHGTGTLIFVSDRTCQLPEGVRLLAVGHPLENCGFCGAEVNGKQWRALVRNYGTTGQKRTWWMETNGQRLASHELNLGPGQAAGLTGEIPPNAISCELVLEPDAFSIDDRLPIVLAVPKRIGITVQSNSSLTEFFTQLVGSLQAADVTDAKPDVQLRVYDPFHPQMPANNAIVFVSDPQPSAEFLPGNVVPENHPFTSDLNWSNLLARYSFRVPAKPGDQTLLWQGDRPLIFLRETGAASSLVVNFDAQASNALRLPSFIVLLHRFIEQVRATKVAPETRNLETDQAIRVAADPTLPPPTITGGAGESLSAPAEPMFFDVKQGDKILLHAAAQFADAREADFRDASFIDQVSDVVAATVVRNSETDFLAPVWALLMGAAMVASWLWRQS